MQDRAAGRRVAVALGAGGARGYAHVGALEVLAERGYEVVAIAGTSMGALVGGVAAAGRLEAYTEWARSLTQREVLRLLDLTLGGGGAFRAERVIAKVAEIIEDARIEDLDVPFTAVATDLAARREVWFQKGPVSTAIRASVAIPGLITPIVVDGRLLVDGGLMNPVPIEPTTAIASDWTLAVSLSGPRASGSLALEHVPSTPVRTLAATRVIEEWGDRLRAGAAGVLDSEPLRAISKGWASLSGSAHDQDQDPVRDTVDQPAHSQVATEPSDAAEAATDHAVAREAAGHGAHGNDAGGAGHPGFRELGTMEVFNRSFDTMAALITRYRMASNPPDVLVTVPSDACRTMDFHRAAELIDLGRRLTREALDAAGR